MSTLVSWDEVEQAASCAELSFTYDAVLGRVENQGDLFAPTLTLHHELPVGPGAA